MTTAARTERASNKPFQPKIVYVTAVEYRPSVLGPDRACVRIAGPPGISLESIPRDQVHSAPPAATVPESMVLVERADLEAYTDIWNHSMETYLAAEFRLRAALRPRAGAGEDGIE